VPALFLAGIMLAGIVSTLIALTLFQDYTRQQAFRELRRQASGLTNVYLETVNSKDAPNVSFIQRAISSKYWFVPVVPQILSGLSNVPELPPQTLDAGQLNAIKSGRTIQFEFVPPGAHRTYLAFAKPFVLSHKFFGSFVVAKPKTDFTTRWATLAWRLALALLGGVLVAGALGWYLSRRITRPVLALTRAADEVAQGHYDVAVPEGAARDEVGQLATRFAEMAGKLAEAEQLTRNFLLSVSHELRTPLTAIRGHVEALREGLATEPEQREQSLDVIAAEAARLERLVQDVLDLAKLDAHRFTVHSEEVDMGRLVEMAYAAFGEEARRRTIDYRQDIDGAPVIFTDGDRVLQIISNLLRNAFRWTPDGGTIELELHAQNGTVSVAVDDSGPGISATERERIFRPFWSRDDSGTGLGLAIARELAVALGGRIELQSEPGQGSRFVLVLPARES
jgi:signal transduction histidine kinase